MAGEGPAPIHVRSAVADDAAALLAIYGPVVRQTAVSFELTVPSVDEFRNRIDQIQRSDPWLVAEADGRLLGYAYAGRFRARPAYGHTKETTVYVDPTHQASGVGRRLMVELIDRLQRQGDRVAVAGIVLPNEASIGLHEALGFRHVGTFIEVGRKFDRWHDLGFWQRTLTRSPSTPGP